jgi:6-phosphofructokinase 1
MIKRIGVLTSGGDSPGMNACLRAVVRTAAFYGLEVTGFRRGYDGIIDDDHIKLEKQSVSGIIQRGGTILKTARSSRFMTEAGLKSAADTLTRHNIEGFVIIGGDGSFRGAMALGKVTNVPMIGCPGTIDNDLVGTDYTIGYDTAINTVVEAIDKIRDTAESHDRVFVVEVMGRDAGLIALRSAIASGAEALLVPEIEHDMENLIQKMKSWRNTKSSKIIVVAEGDESGGAYKVADYIKKNFPEFDMRVSILGHIQRGGNPTCMERVNASLMGYSAVKALLNGENNKMVGIINRKVCLTPFEKAVKHLETLDQELVKMIEILSA